MKALRDRRGLTQRQLSELMGSLGQPILTSGINAIEKGERRVDADDLVALALALEVSPNRLLMPAGASGEDQTELAPSVHVPEVDAWRWAVGEAHLHPPGHMTPAAVQEGASVNRPHDRVEELTLDGLIEMEESGALDKLREGYRGARDAGLAHDAVVSYLRILKRDASAAASAGKVAYLQKLRAKPAED